MLREDFLTLGSPYFSMEAFSFGQLGSYVFPGNHKPHVLIDSESRTKLFAKLSVGPVMALMGLV